MNAAERRPGALRTRPLIAILALAVAVRISALWLPAAPFPDSDTYGHLASGLAERGELREAGGNRARVVPGYPLFLAACRLILGGSEAAWRVPQMLAGAATVLAVFLLARRLFGERAAVFAGLLAALDPFAVYFGTLELTETLAIGLLAWAALLAWRSREAGDDRPAAGLGLAAGAGAIAALALLTRPAAGMIALLLLLGALFLPGAGRLRFKAALARTGLALALLVAALSPWWARNWRVLGAFVPVSTDGGSSLYEGNSPHATGGPAIPETTARRIRELDLADELERDRVLRSEARAWIASHPGEFARLAAVKFGRTWSPAPNFAPYRRWHYVLPSALAWATVMGLAALGVVMGTRGGGLGARPGPSVSASASALAPRPSPLAPIWFCLLPVLFVAAAHMVWIGSVRYRMPAWPFLEMLAGAGAAWLWTRISHRCTPMNTDSGFESEAR